MARPLFSHPMVFKEPTSMAPSGPAGGVLTGTYPDPGLGTGVVTSGNVAVGHGIRTYLSIPCPSGWTIPGKDAWYPYTTGTFTCSGGPCIVLANPALWMWITATAPKGAYAAITIDGVATVWQSFYDLTAQISAWSAATFCYPGAGSRTFRFSFYAQTGATWLSAPAVNGSPGTIYVIELL